MRRHPLRPLPFAALPIALALAGCSLTTATPPAAQPGVSLHGSVHGGQQPISAAHVYLFAAAVNGYGAASTSLLTSGTSGSDSIGGYVLSDAAGSFNITGDYTCTAGQQVYLYALGGDPGGGPNAASGLMAALGACPSSGNFASATPYIVVNELSTIAMAYAVSGFATDPLHIGSSGTPLAQSGILNAFANTTNLVDLAHGTALTTTPAGNGTVPQALLSTLANILASCINSDGSISGPSTPTPCYTLFNSAPQGSTLPTDTAAAAINIAHNPTANLTALFNLQSASPVFAPTLASVPADFTLNLTFTGGGLATSAAQSNQTAFTVNNIAIDASGNIWKPNFGNNSLTELNALGQPLSGSTGFTGGGLNLPANVAVDPTGNVWVANVGGNSVSKFDPTGSPISGSPYTAGGIISPRNIAVDGTGSVWVVNSSTLTKLSSTGAPASGSPFATNALNSPVGIAIQSSGNVWVSNANTNNTAVYNSSGSAAPGSPFTGGSQAYPYGIAFDSSGTGWIADQSAITSLTSTGAGSVFNAPSSAIPTGDAVDGAGSIWITEVANNSILQLSSAGSYLSGSVGFLAGQTAVPEAIAVDGSGNVWFSTLTDATIHELVGAAVPVATPLSYGVQQNLLGTRP